MAPDIVRWGITRASTNIAIDAAMSAPPSSSRPLLGRFQAMTTPMMPSHQHDARPERPAFGRVLRDPPGTSPRPRPLALQLSCRTPGWSGAKPVSSSASSVPGAVPELAQPVTHEGLGRAQGHARRCAARGGRSGPGRAHRWWSVRLPTGCRKRSSPRPARSTMAVVSACRVTRPSRTTVAAAGVRPGGGAGMSTDGSSRYSGSRP